MKRLLPILAVLLAVLFAACGEDEKRSDVLLITMDTTRADFLSCYGYRSERATTPTLDALAAEGTRFELAMATAAVTPVSHASILTGRFNRDHGVRVIYAGSGFRLGDDIPTLATEFQEVGYHTIAVHSAFPVAPYFGLTNGFDVVESFDTEMKMEGTDAKWDLNSTRRADDTIDLVIEKLEQADDPWFLWIHLWDPHDPGQVPPREWMPPLGELVEMDAKGNPVQGPEPDRRLVYAAEVHYMDEQIGRLFDYLKKEGSWDSCIIAATADHGQGLGDHNWPAHRILYQEQIRVPLIVRVPGVQQKEVVGELTRMVDVAPTLLDYAGVQEPVGIAGRSLRTLIEGTADTPRIHFAEQINGYDLNAKLVESREQDDFTYCAMDEEWKITWRPNHPAQSELFQITTDPDELNNLWAWDHPEAIRLKKELARHAPWVTKPFAESRDGASAAAAAAALAKLGYTAGGEGEVATAGPQWEFVCPEHYDQRSPVRAKCPKCSAAMILIAEGK